MSTRWYPRYSLGNPQLRVFLPNFWMKLVPPKEKQPKNLVQFHCSMEMTRFDVKNYLEKIYNVTPITVNTRIALGEIQHVKNYYIQEDDIKIAYVTLPKDQEFTFPTLFDTSEEKSLKESTDRQLDDLKKSFKQFTKHNVNPGVPTWFTIQ